MRKLSIFLSLLLLNLGLALPVSACLDENGNPVVGTNGEMTDCASVESEETPTLKESPTVEESSADPSVSEKPLNPAEVSRNSEVEYFAEPDAQSGIVDVSRSPRHSYFAAGTDVTLRGDIHGLALAAGNNVDLIGSAEYGLLAGNTLKISGQINRDLFAAGQSITLTDSSSISRDVFLAGQTVTLSSNLYGNVFVAAQRLVLDGITIDGDLHADVDELVVSNKSSVSGTFFHPEGTKLTGEDNFSAALTMVAPVLETSFSSSSFVEKLIFFLGRIILTLVLIALFSKLALSFSSRLSSSLAAKSLGFGLLLVLGLPLCAAFSMLTFVGLPLGFAMLLVWLAFCYLGASVSGLALGSFLWPLLEKLFPKNSLSFKSSLTLPSLKYLLGATLLFLISFIPVLNGLATALSLTFGFGYLILTLFSLKSSAKPKKPAKE